MSKTNTTKPTTYKCHVSDDPEGTKPDFIYGGPFISLVKEDRLLELNTPTNIAHSGSYKRSYAYECLKDRLPVILTKVIDYASRTKPGSESSQYIAMVNKLKYDLMTNKQYEYFTAKNEECNKWNEWLDSQQATTYYTNTFLWTECYVYRRLQEGCELYPSLSKFDPFEEQKNASIQSGMEPMCIVAEKLPEMLNKSEKAQQKQDFITLLKEQKNASIQSGMEPMCIVAEKLSEILNKSEKNQQKQDFITLLKLCVWANKCDLALSLGEQVTLNGADAEAAAKKAIDPFQMIIDLKDKLAIDDSGKAYENLLTKTAKIRANIELEEPPPPPPVDGEEVVPPPKIPCPAKQVVPNRVVYDIVCDNTGYELFTDLCFGTFLLQQELVDVVRYHVKKYPWFISDATVKDFHHLINQCANSNYSRVVQPPPPPEPKEGETPPDPEPARNISAGGLKTLASMWKEFLDSGKFIVTAEDFWTYPHVYKDMKRVDPNLYRSLQFAAGILFKGDLNYRKLMGELNTNPYAKMLERLQGFNPAPILACRTVKSEIICGLPKGKFELYTKLDPNWMKKGDYGIIQFCPKAEPFKPGDKPCIDYGTTCFSKTCPEHKDF